MQSFKDGIKNQSHPFILPIDLLFPEKIKSISIGLRHKQGYVHDTISEINSYRSFQSILSNDEENKTSFEDRLVKSLVKNNILIEYADETKQSQFFHEPGLYRLQHASLLFKSPLAAVLVDPVFTYDQDNSWFKRSMLPKIDAIIISHSHGDHFDLTSLLQFPKTTRIILPEVKKPSVLCPNMAKILKEFGFEHVEELPWYSNSLYIKDIKINALPFYGEQPWVDSISPVKHFRNQGNTYIIKMMNTTYWFLIDSGREHGNAMEDICDYVCNRFGRIDVVLSNLRDFAWRPSCIDGSGRYLLCYPEELIVEPSKWPYGKTITFGTEGMRLFLERLEPKYFLPYAHWWHVLESRSHRVNFYNSPSISEEQFLSLIENSTNTQKKLNSKLLSWQVGSRFNLNLQYVKIDKFK